MPELRHAIVLVAPLLAPLPLAAHERATGSVTIDKPAPEPRGAILTKPDGRSVEVPRGEAA